MGRQDHQDNYGDSFLEMGPRRTGDLPGNKGVKGLPSLPPLADTIFRIGEDTRFSLFTRWAGWLSPSNPPAGGLAYKRHRLETTRGLQRVALKVTDTSLAIAPSLGPSILERLKWSFIDGGLSKPGEASFVGWIANTEEGPERVSRLSQEGDSDFRLAVGELAYHPLKRVAEGKVDLSDMVLHGIYQAGGRMHFINQQSEIRLNVFTPCPESVTVSRSEPEVRADTIPVQASSAGGVQLFTVELPISRSMLAGAPEEGFEDWLIERLQEKLRLSNPNGVFQQKADAREKRGHSTDMLLRAHEREATAVARLFADRGDRLGVLRYGVEVDTREEAVAEAVGEWDRLNVSAVVRPFNTFIESEG